MKRLTTIILALVSISALTAQNVDGGANDLMKKVSMQYQQYKTMQFSYTLKTTKDDKTLGVYRGDFKLKGDKYWISYDSQLFICDGESVWNYQKSTNEVSIYEYDPDEDQSPFVPQRILKDWSSNFRAKFIRDEFANNVQYSIVDLTPKTAQSFYRIRLYINKMSLQISKVAMYEKDNTIYTFNIEQFKHDISLDDKLFGFDATKYPGVEVNDMR